MERSDKTALLNDQNLESSSSVPLLEKMKIKKKVKKVRCKLNLNVKAVSAIPVGLKCETRYNCYSHSQKIV